MSVGLSELDTIGGVSSDDNEFRNTSLRADIVSSV